MRQVRNTAFLPLPGAPSTLAELILCSSIWNGRLVVIGVSAHDP